MKTRVSRWIGCLAGLVIPILQFSCGNSVDVSEITEDSATNTQIERAPLADNGRPIGWTEATHSKQAAPDYAVVFPQGEVRRIDITITPGNWQAMLDDMTTSHGAFGGSGQGGLPGGAIGGGNGGGPVPPGGGGNMMPPSGMNDACAALQEGDTCSLSFNGMSVDGTCTAIGDGQLACVPQMQPGFPTGGPNAGNGNGLPGMIGGCDSCEASAEAAACTCWVNGTAVEGICAAGPDGQLTCNAQMGPDGGAGGILNGGGMLGENDANPVVVPCTIAFEGKTWWYAGIRFKGNSSLMSTWSSGIYKLPFRLDLDAFDDDYPEVADQRFFGFEKLSLASNWSDPTYLREKVTHDVFREAGVPAPRTAFYRLYIDTGQGPTYFGLYAMTEIPDNPMLTTRFGDDGGNLYKPTSNWVAFAEADFDKESNKDEADWSDVQAAIAALHADRSDPAVWRAGLEAVFDVDGFLRWLAVNTVIVNWDTYGRMAHNYYLYGNPVDVGRLSWIPWDNNMAFMAGMGGGGGGGTGGVSLGLAEIGDGWPLIRYLMDDPVYKAAYVAHVRAFVENVFDVDAIQARFQAEHNLIAPYVTGAEGEQSGYTLLGTPQEFDTGLSDLLQFVADRATAASEFLGAQQ